MTAGTVDHAIPEAGAEDEFRARVRSFLDGHARRRKDDDDQSPVPAEPESVRIGVAKAYQAALFQAGLAGLTWAVEYGGQGLPGRYQTIFNEVVADYDAPGLIFAVGFGMCIPTVLAHGSEPLKQRYVRPAARGEEVWCQLFSEPSAGSDLAALRSTVIQDGDEWVLNGQKVWSTGAHYADYAIVLARTDADAPKHKGLSMFILDMRAPGIEVRPLKQMNGETRFNEVFFTDVRIRRDHILGQPGEGWRVALTTLMNERVTIGAGNSAETIHPLSRISVHLDLARKRDLTRDPVVRQALADLLIRQWVLDMVGLRIRGTLAAGREPGPEGSVAKLSGAILAQRAAQVAAQLAGPAAIAWGGDPPVTPKLVLTAPQNSIAGGTSEVMRNILGERILGLPKEPQVDRDVPFRNLPHS